MLVIVMHNNRDYLEYLTQLARKEDIKDSTIVTSKGIGTRLIGGDTGFIFRRGKVIDAYDKAFVAVIKGEEKTRYFLDAIEKDDYLEQLNIDDKGFICAVPFHYIKHFKLEAPTKKEEAVAMRITDFLKEDKILLDLKASSKEEAIREVASLLKNEKGISDFDLFLKDVFEREELNTTAIGKDIAIPHARTDAVKEFVIAFARAPQGIEFNSLDNKPVKLIFLMGTPKSKGLNNYLKILACLTRLLDKENFREAILNASSSKEIMGEFRKVEQ